MLVMCIYLTTTLMRARPVPCVALSRSWWKPRGLTGAPSVAQDSVKHGMHQVLIRSLYALEQPAVRSYQPTSNEKPRQANMSKISC